MAQFEYQKYNGYTPTYTTRKPKYGLQNYGTFEPVDVSSNPLIPQNDPYKAMENYSGRLQAAGIPTPEREVEGSGNFLEGIFKFLNMAGSANTNVVNDLVRGAKYQGKQNTLGSLVKSYTQGWTGERQDSTSDILETLGVERNENPDGKWYNPLTWDAKNTLINVASFAGDVAIDPLSWVSFGTLGAAKNAAKGATKEVMEGLVKKQTGHISNIADALSQSLGRSQADIVQQIRGVSKMDDALADTTMRMAYTLGKGGTEVADKKLMNYILNRGLDGVNPDIISKYADDLIKTQANLLEKGASGVVSPLTQAVKSRSGTLSQLFKSSVSGKNGGINLYDAFKQAKSIEEFDLLTGGVENILKIYDFGRIRNMPKKALRVTLMEEQKLKTGILQSMYKNIPQGDLATMAKTMSTDEVEIVESLFNAFGKNENILDAARQTAKEIRETQIKHFGFVDEARRNSIMEKFGTERAVRQSITELDDGIEFANGLQRAYDASKKRFYFRYHNPITNTVKPIIELTNVVQSPAMKRAGEAVLGLPGVRQARDIAGYIFNTEHMGKAYKYAKAKNLELDDIAKKVKDGTMTKEAAVIAKRDVIDFFDDIKNTQKTVPEIITKYNRLSTSLPPRAVSAATNIFYFGDNLDDAFLKNDVLQDAVTHYRQKGLSDAGGVGWELMRGRHIDDVLNEMFDPTNIEHLGLEDEVVAQLMMRAEELKKMFSSPKIQDYISKHRISDEDIKIIERASGRSTAFTEALYDFDVKRGTVFTPSKVNEDAMLFQKHLQGVEENIVTHDTYVGAFYKKPDEVMQSFNTSSMATTNKQKVKAASSAMSRNADEKVYASAFDAMLDGKEPVTNIIMAMSLRNMESHRVALNRALVDDLITAIQKDPELGRLISLKPVNDPSFVVREVGVQEFYVSPDIQNQLNRLLDTFSTNLGMAELFRYTDQVTNMIKKLQTSANPGFLVRNVFGETLMCAMDGVQISSFKTAQDLLHSMHSEGFSQVGDTLFHRGQAVLRENTMPKRQYLTPKQKAKQKLDFEKGFKDFVASTNQTPFDGETAGEFQKRLKKMYAKEESALSIKSTGKDYFEADLSGKGTFTGDYATDATTKDYLREKLIEKTGVKTFTFGNETYTSTELMDEFYKRGLGYSGITKGNLIENAQETVRREVKQQTGNKTLNAITNIGDETETITRLAHFIDKLEKGFGLDEAAAQVRLYHVDYKDLTTVERNLFRRVAPYYTYMRKNLPIQVRNVYTNLGRVNMVSELVRSSYDALEASNNGNPIVTEDYLAEGLALPIGVDEQGNVQYFNWNLPINDLSRLTLDIGDFFDKNVLEMLHPMIRATAEIPANTSLGFNQPIERFPGETTAILPGTDTFEVGKKTDYFLKQLGIVESVRKGAGTVYNAFTGAPKDALKPTQVPLLQSLLPIKNQYNTLNNQAYQYRDQLADYIKLLEQKGIDVPTLEELRNQTKFPANKSKKQYGTYTPQNY